MKNFLLASLILFLANPSPAIDTIILGKHNTIVLNDEVNAESVAKVISDARNLGKQDEDGYHIFSNKKDIYLFLNTPGGSITAGLQLIDALNGLDRKVDTITMFAASMGFQIVQNLGDRYVLPHGTLMSHRARGGIEGEFGGIHPSQLESRMKYWDAVITGMDKQTVLRTNGKQTLESYEKSYVPELWLTGDQAVAGGYADKIIKAKCDSSLDGLDEHNATFMGVSLTYYTDKCPLNPGIVGVKVNVITNHGSMDFDTFRTKGGSFSAECLILATTDKSRVCSLDTTLTPDKIHTIQGTFIQEYGTLKGSEGAGSWKF